jgi:hypothetical protein
MMRKLLLFFALTSFLSVPLDAGQPVPVAKLTAAEIVEKNATARGGLTAWRNVQTLSMPGNMDAAGKSPVQLPVLFELKRPREVGIELESKRDTAVQVFDGTNAWKLRNSLFTQAK